MRNSPHAREPIIRFIVKHPWMTAAVLAVGIGSGAALLAVSGIVPIKASSGHWWITARLLDFAKLQSVKTHALGIRPPDLDDEALVVRGAAHYALGCEPCHGGPDASVPPVMAAMTPPPPSLTGENVERWNAAQLFSIVKHGIKFTGMPAWPVQQRDDEIWAVVAFLERMPRINGSQYRQLAHGDPASAGAPAMPGAPQPVRELCWRCHGVDGTGRAEGAVPSLAGQSAAYLHASLRAFADRTRFSGTMGEIAAHITDTVMWEIADYYERLPVRSDAPAIDPASVLRGATLASRGLPERDIPACVECHGPADTPKNPAYPRLAGQHARYLTQQLELLKQRHRGGSPRVNLMHEVVDRLDASHIQDAARYYASGATAF